MSAVYVDSIKDKSDTKTLATLSSSSVTLHSDVVYPTGMIRQVVSTQTSTYQAATDTAYVDIFTDLQMTTKGANKILVMGNINGIVVFDVAAAIRFNLTDGSSSIQTLTKNYMKGSGSADDPYGSFGFQHLTGVLSASTAYTFNVEFKNNINGSSVRVSGEGDSIRTLTLMEIQQ